MARFSFSIPPLPKPEYHALKRLCQMLGATQLEVLCVGLRLMARVVKSEPLGPLGEGQAILESILTDFRASAPSETAPLL